MWKGRGGWEREELEEGVGKGGRREWGKAGRGMEKVGVRLGNKR